MLPKKRKNKRKEKHYAKLPRFTIVRWYDLRTPLSQKTEEASGSGITVFINQSHTIAHTVWAGDLENMFRTQLPRHLKLHLQTDQQIYSFFISRFLNRILF